MKLKLAILSVVAIATVCLAFSPGAAPNEIEWLTLEEAQARNAKEPRKILIDFYTSWCGWCKRMDAATFGDPVIEEYVSEHYYAVKFDAETSDTVMFKGKSFVNPRPGQMRSTHEIAANMCAVQGRIGYPTLVYLDENLDIIAPVPGYQDAKSIEPLLTFIAEDRYKNGEKFPDFKASFKGNVR